MKTSKNYNKPQFIYIIQTLHLNNKIERQMILIVLIVGLSAVISLQTLMRLQLAMLILIVLSMVYSINRWIKKIEEKYLQEMLLMLKQSGQKWRVYRIKQKYNRIISKIEQINMKVSIKDNQKYQDCRTQGRKKQEQMILMEQDIKYYLGIIRKQVICIHSCVQIRLYVIKDHQPFISIEKQIDRLGQLLSQVSKQLQFERQLSYFSRLKIDRMKMVIKLRVIHKKTQKLFHKILGYQQFYRQQDIINQKQQQFIMKIKQSLNSTDPDIINQAIKIIDQKIDEYKKLEQVPNNKDNNIHSIIYQINPPPAVTPKQKIQALQEGKKIQDKVAKVRQVDKAIPHMKQFKLKLNDLLIKNMIEQKQKQQEIKRTQNCRSDANFSYNYNASKNQYTVIDSNIQNKSKASTIDEE